MCIVCDTKKFHVAAAQFMESMAEALTDSVTLLQRLVAKGAALDALEQQAYDSLLAFAKGDPEPVKPTTNIAVVIDTPERVEVAITEGIKSRKARKLN